MILEAIFSQPMHPIRTAIGRLHVLGAIFEAKAETVLLLKRRLQPATRRRYLWKASIPISS
jgi:hypothetical protein